VSKYEDAELTGKTVATLMQLILRASILPGSNKISP